MRFYILLISLTLLAFSKPLDKVSLHLKWKNQFQFAGFYIAKEKGFYKDLGLDVSIIEASTNKKTSELILNNINSFGISDSILIQEKMMGKKIKILGAIFQETPFIFLSLKKSNINTPKDFINKNMMLDLGLHENSIVRAIINKFNIDEKDINYIPTSYNINDLIEGRVDVFSSYITNEPFTLKEKGIEYSYIEPKDYGLDFYGDLIFTSEKNYEKNPLRVKNFYKASLDGWKYAFENIDETIKIIQEKYNTQNFSYEKLLYEAEILKKLSGVSDGKLGRIELKRINHILSSYYITQTGSNFNHINTLDPFALVNENSLELTKEESEYLKNKNSISYCSRNYLQPYTSLDRGSYKGISINYIHELEKKLSVNFKEHITKNWDECYSLIKEKKVDFTPIVLTKPNLYKYLEVTNPYIKGYLVLATKINEPFLLNLENLKNKKIGVSKTNKNVIAYLNSKYPFMNIIKIDNYKKGLDLVSRGELYGFIGASDSVAYDIQDIYPYELKIMNRLDNKVHTGSIGVQKDNKLLLSILNKTISSIDDSKIREIRNSWVSIKEEAKINYSLIWKIIVVFGIFILIFIYRQYSLKKANLKLEQIIKAEVSKNREKDKILFQQSKLVAMGEMLNNIAHQWRQPLNAINSNVAVIDSKLTKKNIDDRELEDNLADIESQTKYMSDTIESFRTFLNPLKDKDDFLISEAIEDVLRIVKYDYEKNGIRIKVVKQKDISVKGFLGEYIQTIISILHNSRDAFFINKIKDPKITIYIDEMLIIDDNAGGVNKSIIDRVFEPYFTTKHKEKGTGTGLYMAKMIIEHSMDGNLTIENITNGCRLKILI